VFLPLVFIAPPPAPTVAKGAAIPYGQQECSDVEALGATWFYDWSYRNPCPASRAEYVPMIWSSHAVPAVSRLSPSAWLMGPNEPNYQGQAVASPEDVAAMWPTLEATGRKLVSPAVSACENPRNPYCLDRLWLEKFMALCTNCRIDAIAVHWYGCDAKQIAAYLDKRASQFHKPLWLTEWACPSYAGDPVKFMAKALPVIKERVDRYAWFAARTTDFPEFDPLVTNAGLTSLGRAYR
jgi:hypothetical protein